MTRIKAYSDDCHKAAENLRLAVSYLNAYEIPLSPLNYRIGYDCVAGKNEELKAALEDLLTQQNSISEESLRDLYQRFFIQDEASLEAVRHKLKLAIKGIQGDFGQLGGNLSNYASSLRGFASILDISTPTDKILEEVDKVIEDTQVMEQSRLQLESQISNISAEVDALRQELVQVKQESRTDSLTGILNRRAFDEALAQSVDSASEQREPFCLLVVDIDHFKQFNDAHGHLVGDKVLRFVATLLKRSVKGKDIVARFGGEEFTLILPQTDLDGACIVAEQIRHAIAACRIRKRENGEVFGKVTVSVGVAQFDLADSPNNLVERADRALYWAKDNGRNCVGKAEL